MRFVQPCHPGLSFAALLLALLGPATWLRADTPSVDYIFPAGGQRGTETKFRIGANFLHGGAELDFYGSGVTASKRVKEGETTWFDFAEAIFERARHHTTLAVTRVVPISTASFGAPAPRPAFSVLSCERIRERFGIVQRPWLDSLDDTIVRIYSDH